MQGRLRGYLVPAAEKPRWKQAATSLSTTWTPWRRDDRTWLFTSSFPFPDVMEGVGTLWWVEQGASVRIAGAISRAIQDRVRNLLRTPLCRGLVTVPLLTDQGEPRREHAPQL